MILGSIRTISYHSMAASKLVRNLDLSRPADFEILRREYGTASVRLRALCECLEIHRRCHGCDASAFRPEPAATRPHKGSDHIQRRTSGAKHLLDTPIKGSLRALKIKIPAPKRTNSKSAELPEATNEGWLSAVPLRDAAFSLFDRLKMARGSHDCARRNSSSTAPPGSA